MDLEDLEKLATEARQGDSDALAGLCRAFHPKILRYLRCRSDAGSPEDLTAEVFLRVVENICSQKGSFRAWIFRIARNMVIDEGRKPKVRRE